ncbi:MAG: hypothetical protein JW850_15390 [Thermoflexales bacterium]|nr:hypothetical protein [Thermoflexales bacterium]
MRQLRTARPACSAGRLAGLPGRAGGDPPRHTPIVIWYNDRVESERLITCEEILGGLSARRASTLLFLIESRTAYLVAHSRQATDRFLTEEAAQERDMAFLSAFSLGRQPPLRPSIQDLERYAPNWGPLSPETPSLRAALAHSLGLKYTFTRGTIPNIRAALDLDTPKVQESYRRLYHQPLETLFRPRLSLAERMRWASSGLGSRLESLPPFWTAFALTLTETVGAGILALPIAMAGVGPLAGAVLLLVFGLVNILTVAYMAEAVLRSGAIRYSNAYIGRMVRDYLGDAGSMVLSLGVLGFCFLTLMAYYIGFATTLEDATRVPAELWVSLIFLAGLYVVRRESLNATVASALLIGATNIGLILVMAVLALARARPENLAFVNIPFLAGRPFDPTILGLIFGVVVAAYFGHLSVSTCARTMISRDPSGRSLIWGCMAAQAVAMVIYVIWVVAVNGAVDPRALAGESGTALIPLAKEAGPLVQVLGSILATLCMGMASVHSAMGLYNLTRERLPTRSQPAISLPRRQGRLVLRKRGRGQPGLYIALTYLGLQDDGPHLRLDIRADDNGASRAGGGSQEDRECRLRRVDIAIGQRWELAASGLVRGDERLALHVLQASPKSVCLQVDSSLSVTYEGQWDTVGLCPSDVLALGDGERALVTWLMRQQAASLAELAAYLEQDQDCTRELLKSLADAGLIVELESKGELSYQVILGRARGRAPGHELWQRLGQPGQPAARGTRAGLPNFLQRIQAIASSAPGQSCLALSPVLAAFLLTEWALLANSSSFSALFSFAGVIIVSLLAGIFPVLLLISSRQKGEFTPSVVYRVMGHPLILGGIYALSLASLFLHGVFIWQDPWQRAGALLIGAATVGLTVSMKRQGAFAPRVVVTLCEDQTKGGEVSFAVVANGQPVEASLRLDYAGGERRSQAAAGKLPGLASLRRASFLLPAGLARELKVWAYRLTPEGASENLAGRLEVKAGGRASRFDLASSGGPIVTPYPGDACQVDITLAGPDDPDKRSC